MKNELISYVIDHLKHFKCYPMEFEYKNKIYNFNQIMNILKKRKKRIYKKNKYTVEIMPKNESPFRCEFEWSEKNDL